MKSRERDFRGCTARRPTTLLKITLPCCGARSGTFFGGAVGTGIKKTQVSDSEGKCGRHGVDPCGMCDGA